MKNVWVYRRHPGEELLAQTHDFDVRPANYPVYVEFDTAAEAGKFEAGLKLDELEKLHRFIEQRDPLHANVVPQDWIENGWPTELKEYYGMRDAPKPEGGTPAVIHNFRRVTSKDNDPNNWTPREALLSALNEINEHGYDRVLVVLGKLAQDGGLTTCTKQATKNTLEGFGLLLAAQDLLVKKD